MTRWARVALAVALLAGCSGDDGGGDDDDNAADGDGSTTATNPPGVPVVGGTLRMGIGRLDSLDPADDLAGVGVGVDRRRPAVRRPDDDGSGGRVGGARHGGVVDDADGGITWHFAIAPTPGSATAAR